MSSMTEGNHKMGSLDSEWDRRTDCHLNGVIYNKKRVFQITYSLGMVLT